MTELSKAISVLMPEATIKKSCVVFNAPTENDAEKIVFELMRFMELDEVSGCSQYLRPEKVGQNWIADPDASNEPEDPGGHFEPVYSNKPHIQFAQPKSRRFDVTYEDGFLYVKLECLDKAAVERALHEKIEEHIKYGTETTLLKDILGAEKSKPLVDAFTQAAKLKPLKPQEALKPGAAAAFAKKSGQVVATIEAAVKSSGITRILGKKETGFLVKSATGVSLG